MRVQLRRAAPLQPAYACASKQVSSPRSSVRSPHQIKQKQLRSTATMLQSPPLTSGLCVRSRADARKHDARPKGRRKIAHTLDHIIRHQMKVKMAIDLAQIPLQLMQLPRSPAGAQAPHSDRARHTLRRGASPGRRCSPKEVATLVTLHRPRHTLDLTLTRTELVG